MIASARKSVNSLKRDREHGAAWLTRQALDIIKSSAAGSKAASARKIIADLDKTAAEIMNLRPGMVSISNYMLQFRESLSQIDMKKQSPEDVSKLCVDTVESLISHSERTSKRAALNAAKIINSRCVIITCSFSSAVCGAMEIAAHKKIDFKVLSVESSQNAIAYGELTADSLRKSGIITQLVPDNQVYWQMARADLALLGADAISFHGYFINGTPSLELARIAERRKVPLYIVCELSKVDVNGFVAGLQEPESGFDMIPLELAAGIITEAGIIKPADIYEVNKKDIFGSKRARTH
ncbi:MAG: hypothetical protein PHO26_03245 [Dehalococcoidia bacterium]|nr:hypothetical protein [Dehalococcoidia bacterium]MDD5495356.1 hypothetical protein [Dehalococcoidia bacterium]